MAGTVQGNAIANNNNVVSTNAWIDNYKDKDNGGDFYTSGPFSKVYDEDADTPLIRASGHAVTLISHGGNGAFSYLRVKDAAGNTRRDITGNGNQGPVTDIAQNQTQDELKNVWPPQVFAATIGDSKSTGHDKSGLQRGVSDDVVMYMRTDQLFAKAGSGATCVRPAGGDYTCPAFSYNNYVYILDTSKSMNNAGLGDTRYNVSLTTLKNTNDPTEQIDPVDSIIAKHVTSEGKYDPDPDSIGFTGLAYKTKSEMEKWTGADVIKNDSNNYGVVGTQQNCSTQCSGNWVYHNCGAAQEGCWRSCNGTTSQVCNGTKNTYGWKNNAAKNQYNTLMSSGGIKVSNNEYLPYLDKSIYLNYDDVNGTVLPLTDTANQDSTIEKAGSLLTPYQYDSNGNVIKDQNGNPVANPDYLKPDDEGTALYHTIIESAKLLGQDVQVDVPDPNDPTQTITKTVTQYGSLDEPSAIMIISDGEDSISLFKNKDKMYQTLGSQTEYSPLLTEPAANDPSYDQITIGRNNAMQDYYKGLYESGQITSAELTTITDKIKAGYDQNQYDQYIDDIRTDSNISTQAFFGDIMHANYPFLQINIIDVACHAPDQNGNDGCNNGLEDITKETNGYYLPTIDPAALKSYTESLTSCRGEI